MNKSTIELMNEKEVLKIKEELMKSTNLSEMHYTMQN